MKFKKVEAQPNFVQTEKKTLDWWYKTGIVNQYLHRNDNSRKKFRFLDGPITANNPMGVHHAHGRTIKDFFQRYKNMQGFKQRFQNGFDSQGLWVEVEVERDLGLNSKREIEKFGLGEFSRACRKRVEKFSAVQTEQSKRLGMFMDWGNDYYTMSDRNNEHIWHFLKTCHEKGLIYQGQDVMPWCIRCGTAISQHELSDGGYKTLEHNSIIVKFPVRLDQSLDAFFLVWTTTPWTLPANTALAVDPTATYVIIESNEEILVLTEERLPEVVSSKELKLLKKLKGQQLVGANYEPLYNFAQGQNAYTVVTANFVNTNEGTGVVHIAPGAGKEDFQLAQEKNLALITPLDEFGNYLESMGPFVGQNVRTASKQIPSELSRRGLLFSQEKTKHSYPVCWRCKEELVFRLTSEWFIKMEPLRQGLKETAEKVNWLPSFASKRMQDWLNLMGDWPISRRRYWGLALPIFVSDDEEEFYVVGSRQELRELAVEPQKVDQLPELHRPWIDDIKIKSPKSQKTLTRIAAVGDAWLDAGIVPFSTLDYLTDRDYWREWFPFDLISEYLSQVRLWFYSTLVMSYVLQEQAPWQNVLAGGFVVDEKGEEMHKSKGNAIEFNEAADKAGADAMRWLYLREKVANYYGAGKMRFGYSRLDEVRRRFFMILWNSYRFFVNNASLDGWVPTKSDQLLPQSKHELDKWILSRLNSLVRISTTALDEFNSPDAVIAIEEFVVNDFSQWYLRRSRDRVGPTVGNGTDKNAFYSTTYRILYILTSLLAPFTPFLAEEIYQNLRRENDPKSVHLTNWPTVDQKLIEPELEKQMQLVREIVEKGHAARKMSGVKVRQPLSKLKVKSQKSNVLTLSTELRQLIAEELNVKGVQLSEGEDELQVALDTQITPALRREGYAREVIRTVQNLRREAGYDFDDRIEVFYHTDSDDPNEIFREFKGELKQKLLADKISKLPAPSFHAQFPTSAKLNLDGHTLHLSTTCTDS